MISFVQKNNNLKITKLLQFLAEIYNMTVETCTDDDSYCLPAGSPRQCQHVKCVIFVLTQQKLAWYEKLPLGYMTNTGLSWYYAFAERFQVTYQFFTAHNTFNHNHPYCIEREECRLCEEELDNHLHFLRNGQCLHILSCPQLFCFAVFALSDFSALC